MFSNTYGRAQILEQQKQDLKTITTNITKGRRIKEGEAITYKDTYDKTEN
jgi:hypothetical protein